MGVMLNKKLKGENKMKNARKTVSELKKICNPIYKQAFVDAKNAYNDILRKAGLKIMKIADENGYVLSEYCNPDAKNSKYADFHNPVYMMMAFKKYRVGVGTFVDKKYREKK